MSDLALISHEFMKAIMPTKGMIAFMLCMYVVFWLFSKLDNLP